LKKSGVRVNEQSNRSKDPTKEIHHQLCPVFGRWLLELIDKPTHLWVVGHLSKVVRDLVFEIGVSNVSITLGCVGWTLCTSILLSDANDEKAGGLPYSAQGLLGGREVLSGSAGVQRFGLTIARSSSGCGLAIAC
jgi:hypothetical protein